jgi:hypothetical protein
LTTVNVPVFSGFRLVVADRHGDIALDGEPLTDVRVG